MDGLHYPSVYCSINEENSKNEVLHSKLLRGCTWNIFVKLFYFSCLMAVLWKAPTGFLHEYLTLTSAIKDSSNHSSDKSLWLSVWSIFSPQILQFNKPDFSIKQFLSILESSTFVWLSEEKKQRILFSELRWPTGLFVLNDSNYFDCLKLLCGNFCQKKILFTKKLRTITQFSFTYIFLNLLKRHLNFWHCKKNEHLVLKSTSNIYS